METFKWSFGIVFSRLVRLPSLNEMVALLPWADMLNHSCEVETFLDYDKSSQAVVFTTDHINLVSRYARALDLTPFLYFYLRHPQSEKS
ncbi:hypothetical protein GIB67_038660 [Kingdonia uniflora]|uniref:SET domain-containing protein n=1 Tax=Kingdonia uniflora TaxID=39325 RepID=A0A7J7NPX9_9MAGN|nr:hypothetical protein GIB67_038660 [Kingdonia uniflora]